MEEGKARTDQFAYEAFTMAFRIQKILESHLIAQEVKEGLAEDFARLKEKVQLLTRYREDREPGQKLRDRLGPFFRPF